MSMEIIQREADKRERHRGLRVKVAEKPILRPGELKRAQDRRGERESLDSSVVGQSVSFTSLC